jgi:hypothetical protein
MSPGITTHQVKCHRSAADRGREGESGMGIPQGTNRLSSAPVQALRAVFTGIGRVVMAADRPLDTVPPGRRPRLRRGAPPPQASRWRSLDYTGNVRLLSEEDLDDGADGLAEPPPVHPAAPGHPPAPVHPPTASVAAESDGDALPLAGYDSLTLPSIRARLRGLDPGQLRVLAAYERTHAERPEVLGMLERRIEKLEAGP